MTDPSQARLRQIPKVDTLLAEPRLQRAIGVVYRPDNERLRHYHLSRLADEFDVVIHVDTTRAATGVDAAARPSVRPARRDPARAPRSDRRRPALRPDYG